ncbi:MAG: hypothetical protein ACYC6F_04395 [Longimicrobiales bacterium]
MADASMSNLQRVTRAGLRTALTLALTVSFAACGEAPSGATTEHRGDTLFIFADGPPKLPTRVARMDLKVGSLDGDPDLTFGRLVLFAPLASGGFVVFDEHFNRVVVLHPHPDFSAD